MPTPAAPSGYVQSTVNIFNIFRLCSFICCQHVVCQETSASSKHRAETVASYIHTYVMASYGAVPTSGSAPQDDSLDSGSASSVPPAAHGNAEDGQGQSRSWRGSLKSFYERNFGLFLVFVAQSFGSVVSISSPVPFSSSSPSVSGMCKFD